LLPRSTPPEETEELLATPSVVLEGGRRSVAAIGGSATEYEGEEEGR